MSRVFNFGAGPAMLPEEILTQAAQEALDWQGLGMSVMEVSHRSPAFKELIAAAEQDLRELLSIPDNYQVLFLSGPARSQFAAVPMNLLRGKKSADYINTGIWSEAASKEAERYCEVNIAASSKDNGYQNIPATSEWQLNPEAAYVHYTANETINGVEFADIPDTGDVPLVADMTSSLLSQTLDISKFGLIYAGVQKNMGPAGLTVVIVREDLLGDALPITPAVFDYKIQADNGSLYYTPASYACYLTRLMLTWVKQQGGIAAIEAANQRKAEKLYAKIDNSNFYQNNIKPAYRSRMNVPFLLADESLNETFLKESKAAGLAALKGHRFVGGMRASMYNAMPEAGVDALIEFMSDFEKRYAK